MCEEESFAVFYFAQIIGRKYTNLDQQKQNLLCQTAVNSQG